MLIIVYVRINIILMSDEIADKFSLFACLLTNREFRMGINVKMNRDVIVTNLN